MDRNNNDKLVDSLAEDPDLWVVEAFIRHRDEIIQTGDTLEEYGPVFLRIAQEEGHDLPIVRSLLA